MYQTFNQPHNLIIVLSYLFLVAKGNKSGVTFDFEMCQVEFQKPCTPGQLEQAKSFKFSNKHK